MKVTTCTSLASADVARGSVAKCFGRVLGIRLKVGKLRFKWARAEVKGEG